uniref:Fibronectin type III and SPRY domain containing 1 n=1 Tax=Oryctolagus cuniculus TaxID=9986 RepID=G1TVQ4_RABIT
MEDQREVLRKSIMTLAVKNEEIQSIIYALKQVLLNVEANSAKVQEDLEAEFQSLCSLLEELKESMLMKIKQDRASRTYELQNQLAACTRALESSEELLGTANQALQATDSQGFPQAAKQIKNGDTMTTAFRLSLKAKASDNMSHFMVDFAQERQILQALKFLPVPSAPMNLVWHVTDEDSKLDHYVWEYRRTNFEGCRSPSSWGNDTKPCLGFISESRPTEYILTGLKFDVKFMNFCAKACNKAVAREFSEPVTLETPVFMYRTSRLVRKTARGGGRLLSTPRPGSNPSPKRMPSGRGGRDHFKAEFYTVLGDTLSDGGEHYWEVRYEPDSKAFGVGVAYRSLSRFQQLGKTAACCCLHVDNWLQTSYRSTTPAPNSCCTLSRPSSHSRCCLPSPCGAVNISTEIL